MEKQIHEKYSKDGAFTDPVVMCDSCTDVILMTDLKLAGMCPYCGNKRVRVALTLTDEHQAKVRQWLLEGKVDPEWFELFEPSVIDEPHKTINPEGTI
tara:strand:- start:171 stop:464 length:294 start_codon:yes stop_codon:yes gene_type:complete